jgi:hypothetical protein
MLLIRSSDLDSVSQPWRYHLRINRMSTIRSQVAFSERPWLKGASLHIGILLEIRLRRSFEVSFHNRNWFFSSGLEPGRPGS